MEKTHLILIVVGLVAAAFFITNYQSLQGFLVLAANQINYRSVDSDLDGPAWTLTVSLNGQGMSAYGTLPQARGTFTPEDLSVSGEIPLKEFTLEAYLDEQQCIYDISPVTDQHAYRYVYKMGTPRILDVLFDFINRDARKSDFITACKDDDGLYYEKNNNKYYVICFPRYKVGLMGSVQEYLRTYEATLRLLIEGEFPVETTLSTDVPSGKLSNVAYAYWGGNLESGLQCPDTGNYEAFYSLDTNGWTTVQKIRYTTYRSFETSSSPVYWDATYYDPFQTCVNEWKNDQVPDSECGYRYNQFANILFSQDPLSDYSQTTTGTSSDGLVTLSMHDALFFPVITFKISAESLGINQPSASPNILSVSSLPFKAGETGEITFSVENIGDEAGYFGARATCSDGFTASSRFLSGLPPGQAITEDLALSCDTTSDLSGGCTVEVYDRNNPSQYSLKSVVVHCTAHQVCTPGETKCEAGVDFGNLMECNAAGSGWTLIESSSSECEVKKETFLDLGIVLPDIGGFGSFFGEALGIGIENMKAIMWVIIFVCLAYLAYILKKILGGVSHG